MKNDPTQRQRHEKLMSELQSKSNHELDSEKDQLIELDLFQIKELLTEINEPIDQVLFLKKESSVYKTSF